MTPTMRGPIENKTSYAEYIRQYGICQYCRNKYKCLVDDKCLDFSPQSQRKGLTYHLIPVDLSPTGSIPSMDDTVLNPMDPKIEKWVRLIMKTNNKTFKIKGILLGVDPLTITKITEIK